MFFDNLPEITSTYGGGIDDLIYYIYYITGFVFVVLQFYLVYLIIRYRKRDGVKASSSNGTTRAEIMTLLIADVILLALDVTIGYRGIVGFAHIKQYLPPDPAIEIRVIGKQFAWQFIYPGNDGLLDTDDDVVSNGDLYLPVNHPVQLNLRGRDVLHSLFLPQARYKQDILPGREIKSWVELTKTGKSDIVCAELCGAAHTMMKGTLVSMTPDEFSAWHEQASREAKGGKS